MLYVFALETQAEAVLYLARRAPPPPAAHPPPMLHSSCQTHSEQVITTGLSAMRSGCPAAGIPQAGTGLLVRLQGYRAVGQAGCPFLPKRFYFRFKNVD